MKPRLLLVEDDAVSRSFLGAALETLPADVAIAASCAEALRQSSRFDLWLIDANLPDGDGAELLQQLQASAPDVPAIAHTADHSAELRTRLLHAGFAEVLIKPVTAAQLQASVRRWIKPSALAETRASYAIETAAPDWDDHAALVALNGKQEHVVMLRKLFMDELPAAKQAVLSSFQAADDERLRAALHKLRASCGFVGAAQLAKAVARLQQDPSSVAALERFTQAVDALRP
ncbi:response regulator [Pseudoxanthomonas sp. UTMC 1351]|uniref:Hpt domain-containing response regulator n=1 Tax=Pseudoxanthomonas sp. UTMC 1351 TaxID=2695853 RepID=UPI0034CDCDB8